MDLLISGGIHWWFMMGVQIHRPCWEIHIVVIPCHLAKSLQATNSSFIFILIVGALQLDLNWNIMQQVRIIRHYLDLNLNEQNTRFFHIQQINLIHKRKKIFWADLEICTLLHKNKWGFSFYIDISYIWRIPSSLRKKFLETRLADNCCYLIFLQ